MGVARSLLSPVCKSARSVLLATAWAVGALAFGANVSVTDTTGWTAWKSGLTGNGIIDAQTDQQTGQTTDDFVGDATYAGFQQKAGVIATTSNHAADDYILFRARFDTFSAADKWGNGGNFGLGIDLGEDANGDIDLIMIYSEGSGNVNNRTRQIFFGTPGTGANNSPSTTTWTVESSASQTLYVNDTYDLVAATDYAGFGGTQDAWMTIAVSFTTLENAIKRIVPGQSTYDVNYNTALSFIGFTSQQTNALNQDLFGGPKGSETSTTTFAALGALTPAVDVYGSPKVPEPATYLQVGVLLAAGAASFWRRRRISARVSARWLP